MAQKASRTDAELWAALQTLQHDLLDPNLSSAVLEDEIRAFGDDPAELAREGAAFVARIQEERRLSWQLDAQRRKQELEQRLVTTAPVGPMPRGELLARLNELRRSPQLGAPVMTAFRKRKPEESTDEELRALLEDIEALRALDDADKEPESV